MKRLASFLLTAVLIVSIAPMLIDTQLVKGEGTIYINADGSITPSTAPISTADNATYTLNGDIGQMVVERNNIIIDGANHTVFSTLTNYGILLNETSNVTVENMQVRAHLENVQGEWLALEGIRVYSCFNVSIIGNTFGDNAFALSIAESNEVKVSGNNIFKSDTASSFYGVSLVCEGILLIDSSGSIISDNIMTKVDYAVEIGYGSYGNYLYNNTVTQSKYGFDFSNLSNSWASNPVGTDNISSSNTVDGRPVYYWADRRDSQVPSDAGDVILTNCQNITMANLNLTSNEASILLVNTTNSFITQSSVTSNGDGILLINCNNITIAGLNLTSNSCSLDFQGTTGSVITENIFGDNQNNIRFLQSSGNTIYHNQFDFPTFSLLVEPSNQWDNDYPSGGNYYRHYYNGTDLNSGSYQNLTGSDAIGDTPYVIDSNNKDNYPLVGMFSDFNIASKQDIQTICNSTLSDFQFNVTSISFNVSGNNGTTGFCRICIPTVLMNATYRVFVSGTEVPYDLLPCSSSTYSYLYFTYHHSTQEVIITPEFPSCFILALFMATTLLAVIIHKKKGVKNKPKLDRTQPNTPKYLP